MAGGCWRLLTALSLVFTPPGFLRGQNTVVDRVPVLAPNLRMLRDPPSLDPVRLPPLPGVPSQSLPAANLALQNIVGAAGIIFAGHVTSIGHTVEPSGPAPASTNITFQVEQGIRGCAPGQILTIHEWAGLWAGGERYRVGEHVLLFLYPPGKLGLTSPVAGTMGRFAMDSQGRILLNAQHVAALGGDPVLARRTLIPYRDFVRAVRHFSREE
jgi:hypothetical protein